MKVNTVAYLHYNTGESISQGWESLQLHIKFKEKGRLFKTKLKENLVSTFNVANAHLCERENRIESMEEYYQIVNDLIKDEERLRVMAIEMVQEYFEDNSKEDDLDKSKEDLVKKVNNMPKFEITVEIK